VARQVLRAAGATAAEATLDARLLAQHALGWDAARLLANGLQDGGAGFVERFTTLVARRATHEPLAYIVGHREFWNLDIEVSPDVLIPRPETELLVEAALERLRAARADQPIVADVCTGSGCVAIALAVERPDLQLVATDISEAAIAVAAANAAKHGVGERIRFLRTDILSGVSDRFDLIVSNPPYIPLGDRRQLPQDVRDFEPALALFGGDDGLDVARAVAEHASIRLKPGGTLFFECGAGQERGVRELIANAAPLKMQGFKHDLQGIPRVAIARLPEADRT
jgi:release factor glutamine methyltransferase